MCIEKKKGGYVQIFESTAEKKSVTSCLSRLTNITPIAI